MEPQKMLAQGNNNQDPDGIQMEVVEIPLDQLIIKYHPRKNLKDMESLQNSIRRDGLQEPLLVYPTGEGKYSVIDGTRRLKVYQDFGRQAIPCIIKKVGDADAAHLSYVKNFERSAFDPIEIALHLKAMRDDFGYSLQDLEIKGYGSRPTISNKLKLLELPEPIQEKIRGGQLNEGHGLNLVKLPSKKEQERWAKRIADHELTAKRAEIRINNYLSKGKKETKQKVTIPEGDIPGVYFKDSRDMSELPKDSVHLIVSSPPYNVGMEFEVGISYDQHLEMVRDVLKECARVLVPGGTIALNVGDIQNFKGPKGKNERTQIQLMGHHYQTFLRAHQILLSEVIIWTKPPAWRKRHGLGLTENTVHTAYRVIHNYEPIYIFRNKGEREVPSEEIALRSRLTREQWFAWTPAVWYIPPVNKMEGHPAIYPDSLVERLIRMFSYEGDTVLDPWLGSGTTVKVARELNREAVGYEKEAQYKSVIMKKLGFQSMVEILDEVNQSIAEMDAEASDELVPTLVRRPDSELLDLSEFLDWDEGAEDELAAEEGQGEAIQSPDHSEVMTADSPA